MILALSVLKTAGEETRNAYATCRGKGAQTSIYVYYCLSVYFSERHFLFDKLL